MTLPLHKLKVSNAKLITKGAASSRVSYRVVGRFFIRLLVAAAALYFLLGHSRSIQANVGRRDSIEYWTVSHLLLHHQNPYDIEKIFTVERNHGYKEDQPLVLLTPPWSLFMILPLGLINPLWGWVLWLALSVTSLILAMRLCWRLYGWRSVPQNLFWIAGYLFAPIPACLVAAQMGLVLLLGLMLFLFLERDNPFLAGAALVLPFAKPHLLALFWIALFLWVLTRRKTAVFAGFATAFAAAIAIPLLFDPGIFQHYREMLPKAAVDHMFIPALSGVLRAIFFRQHFWVQFVPMMLGVVWCLWFFCEHRGDWNWREHGLPLLVISVLTTPYAWLTDEVVLLPAILQAAVWIYKARESTTWISRIAIALFAFLNAFLLMILSFKIPFATGIYFWSSLVWVGWFFYCRRQSRGYGSNTAGRELDSNLGEISAQL
jgi:Glycosyltransferase family 87